MIESVMRPESYFHLPWKWFGSHVISDLEVICPKLIIDEKYSSNGSFWNHSVDKYSTLALADACISASR